MVIKKHCFKRKNLISFYERLHKISAERVLDVGTGRGQFLLTLFENLASFGSAVGVDVLSFPEWQDGRFAGLPFRFMQMDAEELQFTNNSFDLVAISDSIHHLPEPEKVLAEMTRVLKPDGVFVLREVISDDQNPAQATHTLLHQWCGKVDRAAGTFHNSPYKRAELIKLLRSCGDFKWQTWQVANLLADPFDPVVREEQERLIERTLKRTVDPKLVGEADNLIERITKVGFIHATYFQAIGSRQH